MENAVTTNKPPVHGGKGNTNRSDNFDTNCADSLHAFFEGMRDFSEP